MKTMEKIDLYKLNKSEYAANRKPALVEIKPADYLTIEGKGPPGGELFQVRIGALYGMAFTIKMARKFAGQQDYAVGKLEGQWWGGSTPDFSVVPKEEWCWKLLIRTPDFVTEADLEKAAAVLMKRGKGQDVEQVRLETLGEGRCVQMLHIGPYDKEHETVALMCSFAESLGCRLAGRHHEIYLSDPRRVAPERLKTILRIPVAKAR
jgi:hypothetical protein